MEVAGVTVIELPVPIEVPLPHPPAYQFHEAPKPSEPPTTFRVVELPSQIVALPETDVGSEDGVFTVTKSDVQAVEIGQGVDPSALT